MRKLLLIVGLLLVALVAVRMCFFTVDPTEFVYVTELGRPVATYDGGDNENDAGLHARWPWPVQSVTRLDRRLQFFDLPAVELLTPDPKGEAVDIRVTVEAYACWRIKDRDAVDLFLRRIGTPDRARTILGQRITDRLGAAVAGTPVTQLLSTDPGKVEAKMEEMRRQLTEDLQPHAEKYGIELVDVRLRRFNYSDSVREKIFERIRSERTLMAERHRSEGKREAQDIRSKADAEARDILAKARYEEETTKGTAETEAVRIRNAAHAQDPELFALLKRMEKLSSVLGDGKSVLLLSTHRAVFDALFQQPKMNNGNGQAPAKGAASPVATDKKGG
jgi:modulator of FtsH protease HflC